MTGIDARKLALQKLLRERGVAVAGSNAAGSIQVRPSVSRAPLSHAQQRLWFLDQLGDESSAYVFCNIVHISGELNLDCLLDAYKKLILRHEIFRSSCQADGGVPYQQIHTNLQIDILNFDFGHLDPAERERKLRDFAFSDSRKSFDLSQPPLYRITLFRLSETQHAVVQTMHHIVFDGWSLAVLFRDLKALYESSLAGSRISLPNLPIQYADFAHWEQNAENGLQQGRLRRWEQLLSGTLPVIELPITSSRPKIQSHRGSLHRFHIDLSLSTSLSELAARTDCTLYIILLAAFKVFLRRFTGETDVIVGTPVAGRNNPQIENLVGFFVNTLAIRSQLHDDPTTMELLHRVRLATTSAFDNQDVPFEVVVDALDIDRDLSHNPVFQFMFALQNTPPIPDSLGKARIRLEEIDNGTSLFDLTLNLHESATGIFGYFEYCSDLFDTFTIARFEEHYRLILSAMVSDPFRRISQLPNITEREVAQLREWSEEQDGIKLDDRCVHDIIEEQAARNPDSIAISFGKQALSYGELNQNSNQLAHQLVARGVGPGSIVGIYSYRSPEMIVGILGVMKSGAAYLPLDPDYPDERIKYMLTDSAVGVVVAPRELATKFSESDYDIIDISAHEMGGDNDCKNDPDIAVSSDDIAYLIYTSGSTGRPKGVMVRHRNLSNSTLARSHYYSNRVIRFLLLSSFSFDSSVAGIFWTLIDGGELVLPPRDTEKDILAIAEIVKNKKISHLLTLPSVYGLLLSISAERRYPLLSTVIVAGESCPIDIVHKHHAAMPKVQLYNEYGPTEATVWATAHRCDLDSTRQQVPIGKPIANVFVLILDQAMNPVPIGVVGELYVGGAGVTKGYLNREDLDRSKFLTLQGLDSSNAVYYRSGDRARYIQDGSILFCGRSDTQVKIRGHRIELGEIEDSLRAMEEIGDAVVIKADSLQGVSAEDAIASSLAAYIITATGSPAPSEIRDRLKRDLPNYMIPNLFVFLDELPLSPNGKVDIASLPIPEQQISATALVSASTDKEISLAKIWQDVLGLKTVGVADNFFEIGGDSILSMQIIARARCANIHITPRLMFQYPTIAELAAVAKSDSRSTAEQGAVTGEMTLTPIQRWLIGRNLPNLSHWNQPALLEVAGGIDTNLLQDALMSLMSHHDALRTVFEYKDSTWTAHCPAAPVRPDLRVLDLAKHQSSQHSSVRATFLGDLQNSLSVETGQLLAAGLIVASDNGDVDHLCIVIHHLVVDIVSWQILIDDLETAFKQLSSDDAVSLPAKTTSFKSWAEQLQTYANSKELDGELDHWRMLPLQQDFRIPVDDRSVANTEESERRITRSLSSEETESLLRRVPAAYNTKIDDILLAALTKVIARWSGNEAVLLTMEGHGREPIPEDPDVSRTVGWFTSSYPISLVRTTNDPGKFIQSVKEQLRRIPGRGFGFGLLQYMRHDASSKSELASRNYTDILYNYFGQARREPSERKFRMLDQECGRDHDIRGARTHLLEINGMIVDEKLRIDWVYSDRVHEQSTIETLADSYIEELRILIIHCLDPASGAYTSSDFPEANLDQTELDELLSSLD